MSRTEAQAYYNKGASDGDSGYISAQDAKDAIGIIYDDLGTLLSDAAPENLAATAQTGTSSQLAREDHVHSTSGLSLVGHIHTIANITDLQTTLNGKAPIDSPTFTGAPKAVTVSTSDNSTNIATTAFVKSVASGGTVVPGTHTHAQADVTNLVSDLALKATIASPTFTGDPKAPTPTAGDNDTSIATTAFVTGAFTTHTGAADPHTVYQLKSQKDQANGYPGLDVGSKIAIARLPLAFTQTVVATVFDATKYLEIDVNGTKYKVALVQ